MKKLAILAVMSIAMSAHAVSIQWTAGGKLYGVDADGNATLAYANGAMSDSFTANDPAFVLVYLGENATAVTASDVTSSMVVQTVEVADIIVTTGPAAKQGTAAVAQAYSSTDTVGATYQVFFSYNGEIRDIYTDAEMTSVAKYTTSVSKDGAGAFSAPKLFATGGTGTANVYTSTAVPEPSVALMGLLGLGMLLKRRKA